MGVAVKQAVWIYVTESVVTFSTLLNVQFSNYTITDGKCGWAGVPHFEQTKQQTTDTRVFIMSHAATGFIPLILSVHNILWYTLYSPVVRDRPVFDKIICLGKTVITAYFLMDILK